jgi:hypothetical protein
MREEPAYTDADSVGADVAVRGAAKMTTAHTIAAVVSAAAKRECIAQC